MEKYSQYSDSVTGINPFIRGARRCARAEFANPFNAFHLLVALLYVLLLPITLALVRRRLSLPRRSERVASFVYTSFLDAIAVRMMYGRCRTYLLSEDAIYRVSIFNGRTRATIREVKDGYASGETLVLFSEGGMSNGMLLLDTVRRESRLSRVRVLGIPIDGHGMIKYSRNMAYDIMLDGKRASGFVGTVLFMYSLDRWPSAQVVVGTTFEALRKMAKMEVAEGLGRAEFFEYNRTARDKIRPCYM